MKEAPSEKPAPTSDGWRAGPPESRATPGAVTEGRIAVKTGTEIFFGDQQRLIKTIPENPPVGEDFYGYLVGLDVSLDPENPRMTATFEHNSVRQTWVVPDVDLFWLLTEKLLVQAVQSLSGFGCYQKFIIRREPGGAKRGPWWRVEEP